jgi:hypothetical protein
MQSRYVISVMMLIVLVSSNIELVCSAYSYKDSSILEPYDENRFYLEAEVGQEVTFTYEASLDPVECALYVLQDDDQNIDVYSIDLDSLTCTYNHVGISGQVTFTAAETSGFLLSVLNTVNATQQFDYEWVCTNPGAETLGLALMIAIPFIFVLVFVISGSLKPIRARETDLPSMVSFSPLS